MEAKLSLLHFTSMLMLECNCYHKHKL